MLTVIHGVAGVMGVGGIDVVIEDGLEGRCGGSRAGAWSIKMWRL
jgi:hypothetical protein